MQIDRIKFSKEFFILGAGEWVTAYATIEDGEDWKDCVRKVRGEMIGVYGPDGISTGQEQTIILEQSPVKETRLQSIANDIRTCTQLKVLESYRLIAKSDKELQDVYDQTLKKIGG